MSAGDLRAGTGELNELPYIVGSDAYREFVAERVGGMSVLLRPER